MIDLIRPTSKIVLALLLSVALGGCLGIPDNVKPVQNFELARYLGTWYEVARMDHSFERGLSNVSAQYSQREGGGVTVINRGYKESEERWDEASGKAFFIGDSSVGQLKVSFFGPFFGAYNIVALDQKEYQWSLVVGANTDYLWILSRTPTLDQTTLDQILSSARSFGFNTDELIFVEHDKDPHTAPGQD
jgi:apolipoprotein D and lipocalin family protein